MNENRSNVTTEWTKEDAIKMIMWNMTWDRETALEWMRIPNPLLGGISADRMFEIGRGFKVIKFIQTAHEENHR